MSSNYSPQHSEMTTKDFSVQIVGYKREAVLWLINVVMEFKESKNSHNLLHAYIYIRTERQSRNMDMNQSRYQWNNSKLDDILKC